MESPFFPIELTFSTVIAEVAELQFLYPGMGKPFGHKATTCERLGSDFPIGMVHFCILPIETPIKIDNVTFTNIF